MLEKLNEMIEALGEEIEELEENFDNFEDFNAMDASGGNFDDAYDMGFRHGELYGKFHILCELKTKLESEEK